MGRRIPQGALVLAIVVLSLGFSVAAATPLTPAAWHGPEAPLQPKAVEADFPGPIAWLLPRTLVREPSPTAEESYQSWLETWSTWSPAPPAVATVLPVTYDSGKTIMADLAVLERPPITTTVVNGLVLHSDPLSRYSFDIDEKRRVVTVGLVDDDSVQFEIDYRDGPRDRHRTGIAPVFLGERFESLLHKPRGERIFPLVTPTFDAGKVVQTTISMSGDQLRVRFDTGPYVNLKPQYNDVGDTFLDARITVFDGVVRMYLDGLYYVRPSSQDTAFSVKGGTGIQGGVVTEGVDAFLHYIAGPQRIDVQDGTFGYYKIKTDAEWLQVQWNGSGNAFEFDFDHTYKDRRQLSTQTKIVFAPVVDDVDEDAA